MPSVAPAQALPDRPDFVGALEPSNRSVITRIHAGAEFDLVVLRDGWMEGFRTGMRCEVFRGEALLGELLLARARGDFSIGLIVRLEEGAEIGPGDVVSIKTLATQLPQS